MAPGTITDAIPAMLENNAIIAGNGFYFFVTILYLHPFTIQS